MKQLIVENSPLQSKICITKHPAKSGQVDKGNIGIIMEENFTYYDFDKK
jgi:hypothetical protein